MLTLRIQGTRRLERKLTRLSRRLRDPRPLLLRVGMVVTAELQKGFTPGLLSFRKRLAPVERWTRVMRTGSGATGRLRPLLATGGLRGSIGIQHLSRDAVSVGPGGHYAQVGASMEQGQSGRMTIRPKFIKTAADGHQYIRARQNNGRWITKRVVNGTVQVTPHPRPFAYLTAFQRYKVGREAARYVRELL